MKMRTTKFMCMILAVCTIVSIILCRPAAAITTSSDYLDWYHAALTPDTGGDIVISIKVEALGDMDKVGASTIYLYEAADGKSFSCIETFKYKDYPLMMGSGWDHYKDAITYKGTLGYACYAGDSSGHDEKPFTTPIVYARK